ncbi:MAG: DUF192 domain-containing protein [Candidatus Campbellbacteria bacterium]|nr:DUF192 domain-containing protein [Candidatus Campbellbacteria bacterium]
MKKTIIIIIIALLFILGFFLYPNGNREDGTIPISFGNLTIHTEIADTKDKRTLGLGGRDSLAQNRGMLFVFEEEGLWGFWMKDTRFPIDIIWINSDYNIVHIETDVKPETYPTVFRPDEPALYVIEVNAGVFERSGLQKGGTIGGISLLENK